MNQTYVIANVGNEKFVFLCSRLLTTVMVDVMDDTSRSGRIQHSSKIVIWFEQTKGMEFHFMIDEIHPSVTFDQWE